MACIQLDGHKVPLLFSINDGGRTRVLNHFLHIRLRFVESSIYIKEERMLKSDEVQHFVHVMRFVEDGGQCWFLTTRNYRTDGFPLFMLATSTKILSYAPIR